jgi:hypothetical protein
LASVYVSDSNLVNSCLKIFISGEICKRVTTDDVIRLEAIGVRGYTAGGEDGDGPGRGIVARDVGNCVACDEERRSVDVYVGESDARSCVLHSHIVRARVNLKIVAIVRWHIIQDIGKRRGTTSSSK